MNKKLSSINIGSFCRLYRMNVLNETLEEMSKKYNVSIQTISAFEHGRSTNMNLLYMYYHESEINDKAWKSDYFLKKVFEYGRN